MSRFWASPYAVKSPARSAASPSAYACCASAMAWANGVPAPGVVGVVGVVGAVGVVGVVGVVGLGGATVPPKSSLSAPSSVSDHASLSPKATTIARPRGNGFDALPWR
ncbi:MAG: hypothetical protein V9F04_11020 [Dermatophilaceae bacterium]